MVKARKYVVKRKFEGIPKRDDFEIVEYDLPPLQNGEILIKVEWVSVDPYQRAYHSNYTLPYDQFGYQVGVVADSKDPRYPVGVKVVAHKGWCDYCIINSAAATDFLNRVYKLPSLKGLSHSLGIGAVGMPGATAYFGFLDICKPKAGETVVVSGAAGAVGSIVGQIAKIKGCKVIGLAGSEDKVKWLEQELGFDKAFNYKNVDVALALKSAAPNGVDCYFDNVGGEISSVIINQMNDFGRVSVCGSISSYNDANTPVATMIQPALNVKQIRVEGFIVGRWADHWSEAFAELTKWINNGDLKAREQVTEGFENIYDAFVGMLKGENVGKAVVKI